MNCVNSMNPVTIIKLVTCYLLLVFLASCAPARYETYPEPGYAIASWYGPDFHGRPTSSGELFNMYALTCAHREHQFGTRLKVTNISNNKAVNCLVNDRGPFVSGRDLDLSYAAAREIGLIGPGTGKVRIEYLGRDTRYIREVRYSSDRGPFTIQVGSFKELSNATRLKTALELKYSKVYITETEIDGIRYYRVRIGKFNIKDDAFRLAKNLADEGYSVLITHYDERA
ncbi:MAG: septal ring lytic transglycosylase RlpA family protein [Nitrospirae bacterium]|nr:septal ring lytic transglycosylase RlpA family protein [Nitrospirota bacterium]